MFPDCIKFNGDRHREMVGSEGRRVKCRYAGKVRSDLLQRCGSDSVRADVAWNLSVNSGDGTFSC